MNSWFIRRANVVYSAGGRLPAGFTELAYLQSSGSQYINTGILPDEHTGFEVKLQCVANPTDNFIYGARQGTDGRFVACAQSSGYCLGYGAATRIGLFKQYNPMVESVLKLNYMDSKKAAINSSEFNLTESLSSVTFTNSYITIFGRNSSGSVTGFAQKVFYNIITEGDTIIRHYVPAKRNADDVVGMYDLVSGSFLTNAGSGTFSYGEL